MDELLDSDTGYVCCLFCLCAVADTPLILDISIHAQDSKEDLEYGNHSRIRESGPANIVEILDAEFETQRGQIMVSRKNALSIADH